MRPGGLLECLQSNSHFVSFFLRSFPERKEWCLLWFWLWETGGKEPKCSIFIPRQPHNAVSYRGRLQVAYQVLFTSYPTAFSLGSPEYKLNLVVKCDDFNGKSLSFCWFTQLHPKSFPTRHFKCQSHIGSGSYAPSDPNSEPVAHHYASVPTSTENKKSVFKWLSNTLVCMNDTFETVTKDVLKASLALFLFGSCSHRWLQI